MQASALFLRRGWEKGLKSSRKPEDPGMQYLGFIELEDQGSPFLMHLTVS